MRRLRPQLVGAVALLALLLSGCGDGTDTNPAPSGPSPSATSPVRPTTTDATEDPTGDDGADSTAPDATGTPNPSETAAPPPTDQGATSEPVAQPSSEPPVVTGEDACTADRLSTDLLGFPGSIRLHFCEAGWAYAVNLSAPEEPELLAELVDDRWLHAVTLGDPVCQDDLTARGAPASIAKLVPSCDELAPTAAPTVDPSPTDPGTCLVSTDLYGQTYAELVGVGCAEATAEWEVAEANAEPSWKFPFITPGGWECYVTPHDPTSEAAGSCYGPDGSAYFTLYLP
ncbi:hypothetical protein [Ornithinimicrobium cavernae]|uniref:hypothetical protein n=1 Tax=Ornithinimicrobium cavernae TaxID=2666047 RepID=UPI0012B1868C|nr:hypothetical protein [Ornithinimicrobium cavernae]